MTEPDTGAFVLARPSKQRERRHSAPPPLVTKLSLYTGAAIGLAVMLLGLAVLMGWAFGIETLKSILPHWATMKANSAIGFVFAGAALFLKTVPTGRRWAMPAAFICALLTLALGTLTVFQYALVFDIGIDQLVFDTGETTFSPGRPAPITAINFVMIGGALLLLFTRTRPIRALAQLLAIPVLALSYLALLGYAFSVVSLYEAPGFSTMAFHTAAGQLLLGIGLLAVSPDAGITRLLFGTGEGNRLVRRLVLFGIVLFPAIGWLRIKAEAMGIISTEMGIAFLVSMTLVVFLAFVLLPLEALMQAEDEQERLGAAVIAAKRAENTFRSILNASPEGMIITNRAGEIVMANEQVESLFGYRREELIGQPVELLVPERHQHEHIGHRDAFRREPATRPMSRGRTLTGRRKDGSEVPVEISLSPLADESDFVISSVRDISDRLQFIETLRAKNVELERASKAKDHFLANMSHELRTPLTVIIGFVKILAAKASGPLTPEQEKQLSRIDTNAAHLLTLLNDLLDVARIESGQVELSYEPVDVQSVAEEVAASIRPLAENKGLALEVECPAGLQPIRSNRRRLTQILLNLVNNSVKFTEQGSVRIVVEPGEDHGHREMHFRIIDTGVGIRPEDRDKLFQPFSRLETTAQQVGTGLGLHLSQSLAHALDGEIDCESAFGEGSVFTLTLPDRSDTSAETRLAS